MQETKNRTEVTALVCGASQGIGLALTKELLKSPNSPLVFATRRSSSDSSSLLALANEFPDRLHLLELDAQEPSSFARLADSISKKTEPLDLCINCIGSLQHPLGGPEKKLEELSAEKLHSAFAVNTIPFLLLAQQLKPLLRNSRRPQLVGISAKVGSIEDNKTGGWYGYRMSKAALNMAVKCVSIELGRVNRKAEVLAIHPGTTETALSQPFLKSAKAKYTIHSPEATAEHILEILANESLSRNGRFFSWTGEEIPW